MKDSRSKTRRSVGKAPADRAAGAPVSQRRKARGFFPNGLALDDVGSLYVTKSVSMGPPPGFGPGGIWRIPRGDSGRSARPLDADVDDWQRFPARSVAAGSDPVDLASPGQPDAAVSAVSVDGKRSALRLDVSALPGSDTFLTLALNGRATVRGRVENSIGAPVANAIVAGGETLVRSDANGFFNLTGVPTGLQQISAGVERNPAAAWDFPRIGSAAVNVLPGVDNFVVIRFEALGRIMGTVYDAWGRFVPNVRVAAPTSGGFIMKKLETLLPPFTIICRRQNRRARILRMSAPSNITKVSWRSAKPLNDRLPNCQFQRFKSPAFTKRWVKRLP